MDKSLWSVQSDRIPNIQAVIPRVGTAASAALWAVANLAANRETSSLIAASFKRSSLTWWAILQELPLTHDPEAAKRQSLILLLFSRRLARYLSRRLDMVICAYKQSEGLKAK